MRSYAWTFTGLLLLTGLTFGLSFLPLGAWGAPIAIFLALFKSVLIVLFFMHLVEHRVSSRLTIGVAAALAAALVAFALLDVRTRDQADPEGSRAAVERTTPADVE